MFDIKLRFIIVAMDVHSLCFERILLLFETLLLHYALRDKFVHRHDEFDSIAGQHNRLNEIRRDCQLVRSSISLHLILLEHRLALFARSPRFQLLILLIDPPHR